jgi:hypothetical protein
MPAGRNTVVSEDGLELKADKDGFLRWNGDKIDVAELYIVKGGVNLRSGNVKYQKDVEVHGDVAQGFEVVAGGDVRIHGTVDGGKIVSEDGRVEISGSVLGNDGAPAIVEAMGEIHIGRARFARIESKTGNVTANFAVEHCEIKTPGNLVLRAGPAMNCVVDVGGKVDVLDVSTKRRPTLEERVTSAAIDYSSASGNRRKYLRVTLDPPPTVHILADKASDNMTANIQDLSAGGMKLRLENFRLREGDRHRLQFQLEGLAGTMWMDAEVVRQASPSRNGSTATSYGVKFTNIEPAVRESLARFCMAEDMRQRKALQGR